MHSTAAKLVAAGVPGALLGVVICENLEAITTILKAVMDTFS